MENRPTRDRQDRRRPVESRTDGRKTSADSRDIPEVLRVSELAALLRMNRKSVYAALEAGLIPGARRVGRAIRVSRDAVMDWLARSGRGR